MSEDINGSGVTCRFHSGHDAMLEDHATRLNKHDEQIANLHDRVRPWVAWAFGGCGVVIGSLTTLLGVMIAGAG